MNPKANVTSLIRNFILSRCYSSRDQSCSLLLTMADGNDSNTGVQCTEIAEALLLQPPELSNSVFPVYAQFDSSENHSSLASSCSKQVKEIIQDLPIHTSSMNVKCLSTEEDQQMLDSTGEKNAGSCDLASGSFDCEENMNNCGRKNGTSKDSVLDFVSGCEQKSSDIEENKGFAVIDNKGSENVLEAKKKQLLAKVDAGAFKDEVHALGSNSAAGISGDFKGIDESSSPSLEIEVVDNTASIGTVSENNGKKNEKLESDGKKAKRPRRKGKNGRKYLETCDIIKQAPHLGKGLNGMVQIGGVQNGGNGSKYTREEMEALRYVDTVGQKNLWRAVYNDLADVVMREYKDLACSRNQKNNHLKCDQSQHVGKACSENGDAELHTTEENEVEKMKLMNSGCCEDTGDANSLVEEVSYEEEDSEEEYASIQRPAFHVEGEPDFESGPPEDGWEYLRRVRWEAANIPKVTVAKRDKTKFNKEQSVYMPQIPEIDKCPQQLLPSTQWESTFLSDFSELRKLLSYNEDCTIEISSKMLSFNIVHEQNTSSPQLAESTILEKFNDLRTDDEELLDSFCPNIISDQQSVASAEDSNLSADPKNICSSCVIDYPRLFDILAMDAVARVSMLRKRISLAETATTLSKNECVWLFALCAAVDTPLDADTSAALRSLLRKCASLRAAKSELDDEVIMLNILATISGKYFGQLES